MTPDEERWAEALAVERWRGRDGPAYIAGRVAELAVLGDDAGVVRWREISARYDELLAARGVVN